MRSVFIHLLCFVLTTPAWRARAGGFCENTSQIPFWKPRNLAEVALARDAAITAQAHDLSSFCKWNRMDRLAEGLRFARFYRQAKMNGDLKAAEELLALTAAKKLFNPWLSSLAGTKLLKNVGASSAFSRRVPGDYLREALEGSSRSQNFDFPGRSAHEFVLSNEEINQACSYMNESEVGECLKATNDLIQFARMDLSLAPVLGIKNFQRILRDPGTKEGLFGAARFALSKSRTEESERGPHFFDDLVKGYLDAGYSQAESNERAWDVAYLYSVGGPNFYSRTGQADSFADPAKRSSLNPNAVGAQVLFEALVRNDTQPEKHGRSVYSLPANANFPCDSGKSYHFWMSGYLARVLRKKGYSPDLAAKVAFSAAVGYQLKPIKMQLEDMGRGTNRKSGRDYARFGTIENGMRIDLNLAAAGAVFGASEGSKLKDISRGFQDSLLKAGSNPNATPVDKENFEEMLERLQPRKIFDYYNG